MKKSFLIIATAILALTGCTKEGNHGEGPAPVDPTAISFSVNKIVDPVVAVTTRATETTINSLSSIYVSAIYDGARYFTTNADGILEFVGGAVSGGSRQFISNPKQLWPGDIDATKQIQFVAYAPELNPVPSIDAASKVLTGFEANTDIKKEVDFISADAQGYEGQVPLNFEHNLSQLRIEAIGNPNCIMEVHGVRIAKINKKGNFDFATKTWSAQSDPVNYEISFATPKTLNAACTAAAPLALTDAATGTFMIVPQNVTPWDSNVTPYDNGAYIGLDVRITDLSGAQLYPATAGGHDWAVVALKAVGNTKATEDFEKGKVYTLTIDYSAGAGCVYPDKTDGSDGFIGGNRIFGDITLSVSVNPWTPVAGITVSMPHVTSAVSVGNWSGVNKTVN